MHRGLHYLSTLATEHYEAVRGKLARLPRRARTRRRSSSPPARPWGSTSSATAGPRRGFEPGDEIVLSVMEHHANIVPWHFLRERQGAVLKWVEIEPDGVARPAAGDRRHRPAHQARRRHPHVERARHRGRREGDLRRARASAAWRALVDGSQAAVHSAVDVADIGCDFYAITGHKLYGPTGSGALYVRRERYAEMRPFLGGGDMIREVRQDGIAYADPPMKFEAGTPGDRRDHRARRGDRLRHRARHGQHRRARALLARLRQRPARGPELAEPAGHRPGQGGDLLLHPAGRRRTRTTSRPWSTARAWRCAPATTAPSR